MEGGRRDGKEVESEGKGDVKRGRMRRGREGKEEGGERRVISSPLNFS